MQDVSLYFANGLFCKAKAFSGNGTSIGEVVFNTSLTGYQEIITDPSYTGQFIAFTMPEIGIVGVNTKDTESRSIFCRGVIVRHYHDMPSNFRSEQSLKQLLDSHNILGICEIDTRTLTKIIRTQGAMMMIASTQIHDKNELASLLRNATPIESENHIDYVSTKTAYTHKNGTFDFVIMDYQIPPTQHKIIAIDFGIKRSILNELVNVGLEVEVMPYEFSANDIISRYKQGEIQGVFLSNGPGDPKFLKAQIAQIKLLIEAKIPIFGICLGHQLLAIANGYETYKLKFGHHGGNHPVKNISTDSIEITAQNHIYSVPEEIEAIATITHRNLFDSTIEGVAYKNAPVFSIQHHPEASPGPRESTLIFQEFAKLIKSTI